MHITRIQTSCWPIFFVAFLLLVSKAVAADSFELQPPSSTSDLEKRIFWATQYYVSSSENSNLSPPTSYPLLGKARASLGAGLLTKEWCSAALEGTTFVKYTSSPGVTFNYRGLDPVLSFKQADCVQYYPHLASAASMTRTLYIKSPADSPFGLGDQPYLRLVPFRTVAVDRSVFPSKRKDGTRINWVFFVPSLKGAKFKSEEGIERTHDGYVMAADTGGAIKEDHVDVFTGHFEQEFAPQVIKSRASSTFSAFIVQDPGIIQFLSNLHSRPQ